MNVKASILLALLVVSCAVVPAPQTASSPDAARNLNALAERYFEESLAMDPLGASSLGDYRWNDRFTMDITDDWRRKKQALDERYLRELAAIDAASLPEEERLTHEILRRNLENEIAGFRFPSHLLPINQMFMIPTSVAGMGEGSGIHPFRNTKDYDDWLARLRGFGEWTDVAIANMRRGMATGVVQPRIVVERSIPQLEALIAADVTKSVFWGPMRRFPEGVSAADRQRLEAAYRTAIDTHANASYRKLVDFLRNEYLPKTRETVALTALPNGREWYAWLVRQSTTTNLTPDEIHDIGQRELVRISGEMEQLKNTLGFQGDLVAFTKSIQSDPKMRFTSRENVLEVYRDIKRRVDAATPRLFARIPKADYEVRAVEEYREQSYPAGAYQQATPDGSRPGVFYANTFNATERSKHSAEALSLHEGAPGHHFQISIQQELAHLPRVRRFSFFTAYVEGWGLYAESLGRELGVYTDPYQYYGRLTAERGRAMRLVLDTGIHSKGWTREKALEEGAKITYGTPPTQEVDRYIAIPGQALAYKLGQMKITELRRRAETALGPKFDVKAFHAQVLDQGALPLDVLEAKIERWIGSR